LTYWWRDSINPSKSFGYVLKIRFGSFKTVTVIALFTQAPLEKTRHKIGCWPVTVIAAVSPRGIFGNSIIVSVLNSTFILSTAENTESKAKISTSSAWTLIRNPLGLPFPPCLTILF
jgi:hypothetical protein